MSEPQDTTGTPGAGDRPASDAAADAAARSREEQGRPRGAKSGPGSVRESLAYRLPAGKGTASPALIARIGAEAFGSFVVVLAGLGVALYAGFTGLGGGPLAVGIAFGFGYLAASVAVGHVSGAHFNPALTLGAAIAQRVPWRDVIPYWIAQLVGSAFAAAVLFVAIASFPALGGAERTFFATVANGFGEHSPIAAVSGAAGEGFGMWGALLIECIVTAVFVGVALGSTDRRSTTLLSPFSIGLGLAVMMLVAIPITNGSLNPARSTAAAIFSESWAFGQLWVFWVAPLVGAAIAAIVYRAFAPEPSFEGLQPEVDDDFITVTGTGAATGTGAGPATGATGRPGQGGTGDDTPEPPRPGSPA
ncbi:aquaporin [Cellulomonas cellasea]|uniref:aquaporin n=1 Tax=Cellulomonas cellasea TaxID=43670 RepID=UPI0025A35578|nr:aquaporin [Cellulomonas cellasea]MDM8086525.1 aquaporin [Cellulomonas cellasea]